MFSRMPIHNQLHKKFKTKQKYLIKGNKSCMNDVNLSNYIVDDCKLLFVYINTTGLRGSDILCENLKPNVHFDVVLSILQRIGANGS